MPGNRNEGDLPLAAAIVIYAVAFIALAWPWLSGAVTIPWDGKSPLSER